MSFTKLGVEEFGHFLKLEVHQKEKHKKEMNERATDICTKEGDCTPNCHTCQNWAKHKRRAQNVRWHYKPDAEKNQFHNDLSICSTKTTVFTKCTVSLPSMKRGRTFLYYGMKKLPGGRQKQWPLPVSVYSSVLFTGRTAVFFQIRTWPYFYEHRQFLPLGGEEDEEAASRCLQF